MGLIPQESLQALLGSTIIHCLNLQGPTLREDFVKFKGLEYWLQDKAFVSIFIKKQTPPTIQHLLDYLEIVNDRDTVWKTLAKQWPLRLKDIFRYFEADIAALEHEIEVPDEVKFLSPIKPGYALFPHQERVVSKFNEGSFDRAMLHMPTGSGKTRTSMTYIARKLGSDGEFQKVLWLADTEELCGQAAEEFEKAWGYLGDKPSTVCRLWGAHGSGQLPPTSFSGLIVCSIQTLTARFSTDRENALEAIARDLDLIVFDEAHKAIAPTWSIAVDRIIGYNRNVKLIGLTATPGRIDSDGDERLSDFFHSQKVKLEMTDEGFPNPVTYLIANKYLAEPKFVPYRYFTDEDGLYSELIRQVNEDPDFTPSALKGVGKDVLRNELIFNNMVKLCDSRRHSRIIYFAPSVNNSDEMAFLLQQKGFNAHSVSSKTIPSLRHKTVREYCTKGDSQMILCNFNILTTGFDAPQTSAAFIARPTKSLVLYSQMMGRALRGEKAGGNSSCEIHTVVDDSIPGFDHPASAFDNWEEKWDNA